MESDDENIVLEQGETQKNTGIDEIDGENLDGSGNIADNVDSMYDGTSETSDTSKRRKHRSYSEESSESDFVKEQMRQRDANQIMVDISNVVYPKKLGYSEVEKAVKGAYNTYQDYYSSAFDIIASYIKAQKILYMEAYNHCTKRLNYLMLPAIFLSALASVLALATDTYEWGSIAVSGVNAFNGFLLSVISYSKYDAAAEAHKITSHQYDKLQSMCEFTSGCIMIIDDEDNLDTLAKRKLEEIETKIKEIKETNGFLIPESVRKLFPTIYNINLFSKIKTVHYYEITRINKLKDFLNAVRRLEYLQKTVGLTDDEERDLKDIRNKVSSSVTEIIQLKDEYSKFEEVIVAEIKKAFNKKKGFIHRACDMWCSGYNNHNR